MTAANAIRLNPWVANDVETTLTQTSRFAGIIGDRPSQYAKSPSLWNPSFKAMGVDAFFTAFDVVDAKNLPGLVSALRDTPSYLGGSVTVPYKIAILDLLDTVDPKAKQIGAVNTIVRTDDGRLVGYNTDGQGAINSLVKPLPGQSDPVFTSLTGLNVVLIGYGGAARAAAFFLADAIGASGHLTITGRDAAKASELAVRVAEAYKNTTYVDASSLESHLTKADLVVNATTKGQAGLRSLPDGRATCLEAYNALGPANPKGLIRQDYATQEAFMATWFAASSDDIHSNHLAAEKLTLATSSNAVFMDLIYAPFETEFLRLARFSGRRTLNGKAMNIWQAVDGFCGKVMKNRIAGSPMEIENTVFKTMASVW
jgi:shikimate dehydrogenase